MPIHGSFHGSIHGIFSSGLGCYAFIRRLAAAWSRLKRLVNGFAVL